MLGRIAVALEEANAFNEAAAKAHHDFDEHMQGFMRAAEENMKRAKEHEAKCEAMWAKLAPPSEPWNQ